MAIVNFTARARDAFTLELPESAQVLGLMPGDEVDITVGRRD